MPQSAVLGVVFRFFLLWVWLCVSAVSVVLNVSFYLNDILCICHYCFFLESTFAHF